MQMELSLAENKSPISVSGSVDSSIFPAVPNSPIHSFRREVDPVRVFTRPTSSTLPSSSSCRDSGYGSSNKSTENCNEFTVRVGKFIRRKQKVQEIAGPIPEAAKRRFIDLREEFFSKAFIRFLDCDRSQIAKLSIKPKLLGQNQDDASLYIVILCDASLVKKIQRYCQHSQLKKELASKTEPRCPGFRLHVCPLPPEFVAADLSYEVERQTDSIVQSATLCGTVVRASSPSKDCVATIGGLVKLSFNDRVELFAMTADHLTAPKCGDEMVASLKKTVARYALTNGEKPRNDVYDSWNDDNEITLTDEASLDNKLTQMQFNEPYDRSSSTIWRPFGKAIAPSKFTAKDVNLDWSLIAISDANAILPNLDLSNSFSESEFSIYDQGMSITIDHKRVFFLDSSLKRRHGVLSLSPAYLYLGQGDDLIETFTLRMDHPKDVRSGDSGTWVVDEESNQIFGYIVALDLFHDAYVVPLTAAFGQILHNFEASSVELPSLDDVEAFRKRISIQAAARTTSAAPSFFQIVQLGVNPDESTMHVEHTRGDLDLNTTIEWLKPQVPMSPAGDQGSTSSLKLLILSGPFESMKSISSPQETGEKKQIEFGNVQRLFQKLNLPESALQLHIKSKPSFADHKPDWHVAEKMYDRWTYHCGDGSRTLVWSFDPSTRSTTGMLLDSSKTGPDFLQRLFQQIKPLCTKASHPMFMAYLIIQLSVADNSSHIDSLTEEVLCLELKIRDEERKVRNHPSPWPTWGENLQSEILRVMDRISKVKAELNRARSQLRLLPAKLSWIEACNGCYIHSLNQSDSDSLEHSHKLSHTIDGTNNTVAINLHVIDSLEERLDAQNGIIVSIWARLKYDIDLSEARVSEEMAFDTKRDSQAMKTLTAVTLLLLPGTFVASLLGMSSGEGPNFNIRAFIAVWISITVLTTILWLLLAVAVSKGKTVREKWLSSIPYWFPCLPFSRRPKVKIHDDEGASENRPQFKSQGRFFRLLDRNADTRGKTVQYQVMRGSHWAKKWSPRKELSNEY